MWGSPVALAVTLAARLAAGPTAPFAAIFWLLLAALVALAGIAPGLGRNRVPEPEPAE